MTGSCSLETQLKPEVLTMTDGTLGKVSHVFGHGVVLILLEDQEDKLGKVSHVFGVRMQCRFESRGLVALLLM